MPVNQYRAAGFLEPCHRAVYIELSGLPHQPAEYMAFQRSMAIPVGRAVNSRGFQGVDRSAITVAAL